jgi:uncharacterized protein YndB with AHSA1/START domain
VQSSEPLTLEVMIEASPETVFEFFVDPSKMRRWMGSHVVLDPRRGGVFAVDNGDNHARGAYVVVDPPERVVFTWGWEGSELVPPGSSTVTVELEAAEGGTLVRLVHSDLPAGEDVRHSHGWTHYLGRLTSAAAGKDPGPDPYGDGQTVMHEVQSEGA